MLKTGGRAGSGGIRTRMRNILVAIELALATMLLIGAGLFIQTLVNLQSVKLGFSRTASSLFKCRFLRASNPRRRRRPCSSTR